VPGEAVCFEGYLLKAAPKCCYVEVEKAMTLTSKIWDTTCPNFLACETWTGWKAIPRHWPAAPNLPAGPLLSPSPVIEKRLAASVPNP
jgi:hypothetical protein